MPEWLTLISILPIHFSLPSQVPCGFVFLYILPPHLGANGIMLFLISLITNHYRLMANKTNVKLKLYVTFAMYLFTLCCIRWRYLEVKIVMYGKPCQNFTRLLTVVRCVQMEDCLWLEVMSRQWDCLMSAARLYFASSKDIAGGLVLTGYM